MYMCFHIRDGFQTSILPEIIRKLDFLMISWEIEVN